jgi:hypothetical protein
MFKINTYITAFYEVFELFLALLLLQLIEMLLLHNQELHLDLLNPFLPLLLLL